MWQYIYTRRNEMTAQEYMDKAEQFLVHTYNRFKIVIEKGDGVYLYDVNGKKYLDFGSRNCCICIRIYK